MLIISILTFFLWFFDLTPSMTIEPPEIVNIYELTNKEETIKCEEPKLQIVEANYNNEIFINTIALSAKPEPSNISLTDEIKISEDHLDYIFYLAKDNDFDPYLLLAQIEKESRCNPNAIGDNGESEGYLQIQKKWWGTLMEKLEIDDLLNPYQNIDCAIAIIKKLKSINDDPAWWLMAYNGGIKYANDKYKNNNISNYAQDIIDRAEELKLIDEYNN